MEFKKCVPVGGTWKLTCVENLKQVGCALGTFITHTFYEKNRNFPSIFKILHILFFFSGMSADQISAMENDCVTLKVEDHCPVYRMCFEGKCMKKDVCFKLGEECCHYDPMMKCNVKMTVEKCGNNKFMACCKYDNGMCAMVCATVNCNFMIRVSVAFTKFLPKKY